MIRHMEPMMEDQATQAVHALGATRRQRRLRLLLPLSLLALTLSIYFFFLWPSSPAFDYARGFSALSTTSCSVLAALTVWAFVEAGIGQGSIGGLTRPSLDGPTDSQDLGDS